MKSISAYMAVFYCLLFSAVLCAQNADVIERHGIQLGEQKMYNEAVVEFDRALDISNKKLATIHHNKAWVLELKGDLSGAISHYSKAVDLYPAQIVSGEKLGFLYYSSGDYDNAVKTGELVLKIDPENKRVREWLSDAYLKKLEQERLREEAKRREEEEKALAEKKKKLIEEIKRRKEASLFYGSFDFMIRTGYYPSGGKGFEYITDDGIGPLNFPERFFFRLTPTEHWQFDLKLGNPNLGNAIDTGTIKHNETFEFGYRFGKYLLGTGFMLNHINTSKELGFGKYEKLTDFKMGFIFDYKAENYEMEFTFYPRLIPSDGESSKGVTFDVDFIEMKYKYIHDTKLSVYSVLSMHDFYVFDHDNAVTSSSIDSAGNEVEKTQKRPVSNYWGVYNIEFGVIGGAANRTADTVELRYTIGLVQRFYMLDLANEDPYSMKPNGQGWFGINFDMWFKGKPFSGYNCTGTAVKLKLEELVTDNITIHQMLMFELDGQKGDESHYEFNLELGIAYSI